MNDKFLRLLGFNLQADRIDKGLCPICGEKPDLSLMDDTDLAEFGISGMCKKCQDIIFKGNI